MVITKSIHIHKEKEVNFESFNFFPNYPGDSKMRRYVVRYNVSNVTEKPANLLPPSSGQKNNFLCCEFRGSMSLKYW
jgi:hypothetical protein